MSEEESLCGKYNSGTTGAGYRATTILRSSTAFAPQHSGTATTCLGLDAARLTSGDDGGSVSASLRRRPTPPPVFRIQSLSVPDSEAPPPPSKSATLEWTCGGSGGGGRQRQSMRLAGCPAPGSGYLDYAAAPQSGVRTLADFRKGGAGSSLTVHVNHHIVPQPACNSSGTTAARRQQVEDRHNGPF